jgi:DNA polymerase-1
VTAGRRFDELDPDDPGTAVYVCADTYYTFRLRELFNDWFARLMPKHQYIVEQVESPTAVFCGIMRYNGLLVEAARMTTCREQCKRERERLRNEIAFIIGDEDIGAYASTKAFKSYLYDGLKLPVLKVTDKNQEAADNEAFILLAEWREEHQPDLAPLFNMVQSYRRWGKVLSTYVDGYAKHINPATGRTLPDLLPLATKAERFVARNPNC